MSGPVLVCPGGERGTPPSSDRPPRSLKMGGTLVVVVFWALKMAGWELNGPFCAQDGTDKNRSPHARLPAHPHRSLLRTLAWLTAVAASGVSER